MAPQPLTRHQALSDLISELILLVRSRRQISAVASLQHYLLLVNLSLAIRLALPLIPVSAAERHLTTEPLSVTSQSFQLTSIMIQALLLIQDLVTAQFWKVHLKDHLKGHLKVVVCGDSRTHRLLLRNPTATSQRRFARVAMRFLVSMFLKTPSCTSMAS